MLRKLIRRNVLKGAASSVVVLAVAGAVHAQDKTLSFRFNDPDASGVEAAIAEYEAANPDVKIDFQRLTWGEARQQYLREYAVGGGPDVVHIAFVWPKSLGRAGALLPLNDLIEKNGLHAGIEDFVANDLALDEGTYYAVPWTTDTWSMIYNTEALERAGISKLPSTWDEMLDFSRTIREKTGNVGFAMPLGSASTNTIWFLANYYWWSNGTGLVVEDGNGGFKIGINEAEIAEAMTYFKTYLDEGLVPESYLGLSSWFDPVIIESIADGSAAAGVMPPPNLRAVVASYKEKNAGATDDDVPFQTAKTMTGSFKPQTHLGGKMLGINPNTEDPDLAFDFLSFMTSARTMSENYNNELPAQRALLATVEVEPWMGGTIEQLSENARVWGAYSEGPLAIPTMWNAVGREFGSAFVEEKTIEEAAADLLATLNDEFEKAK